MSREGLQNRLAQPHSFYIRPHPFCRGIRKGDQPGTCKNAKLVFQIVPEKKQIRSKPVPCLQGSGCSLVSQAWEIEHMMAFREPVAHSWTSSWVTSALCVVPPEENSRDSASCRRGSGCCASTNSAKYLCKAQVLTYQAQIILEAFGITYKPPVDRVRWCTLNIFDNNIFPTAPFIDCLHTTDDLKSWYDKTDITNSWGPNLARTSRISASCRNRARASGSFRS